MGGDMVRIHSFHVKEGIGIDRFADTRVVEKGWFRISDTHRCFSGAGSRYSET